MNNRSWCGAFDRLMADEQDSDDDEIMLSASTLAALQEFYAEHAMTEHCAVQEVHSQPDNDTARVVMPAEDWVTAPLCLSIVN